MLVTLLFPFAIYRLWSTPFYVALLLLLWLGTLFPILNNGKPTLHKLFRKKAQKVMSRICEIHLQECGDARVISYLRKINPFVFEELILLAFEKQGFHTIPNKRYTGDGGIDGRVNIYGNIWPVQAKRYGKHIKKSHVDDFNKLLKDKNYYGGVFIHTGRTGKEIRDTYRNGTLIILSGSTLVDFLCYPQNNTFVHLLGFRGVTVM